MAGYTYWFAEDSDHHVYALVATTPEDMNIPYDAPEGISGPLPQPWKLREDWPHRHEFVYTPVAGATVDIAALRRIPLTTAQVPASSEGSAGYQGRSFVPAYTE